MLKRFRTLFYEQLTQGATPKSLALGCSTAFALSIFPIIGVTTIFCIVVGNQLKLNQPIMQGVNYLLAPIQLLMIPLFLKLGKTIFGGPELILDLDKLQQEFLLDWTFFLSKYGAFIGKSILAWLIVAPIAGVILYALLHPLFAKTRFSLPKIDSSKL